MYPGGVLLLFLHENSARGGPPKVHGERWLQPRVLQGKSKAAVCVCAGGIGVEAMILLVGHFSRSVFMFFASYLIGAYHVLQ